MSCMKEQNPDALWQMAHEVSHAHELGHLPRERRRDPFRGVGFIVRNIGPEQEEGEEVSVPGGTPGFPENEVKKGFLLQQARGWIEKGSHQVPLFPYAWALLRRSARTGLARSGTAGVAGRRLRAMLRRGRGYRDYEYLLLKVQKATATRRLRQTA